MHPSRVTWITWIRNLKQEDKKSRCESSADVVIDLLRKKTRVLKRLRKFKGYGNK